MQFFSRSGIGNNITSSYDFLLIMGIPYSIMIVLFFVIMVCKAISISSYGWMGGRILPSGSCFFFFQWLR